MENSIEYSTDFTRESLPLVRHSAVSRIKREREEKRRKKIVEKEEEVQIENWKQKIIK